MAVEIIWDPSKQVACMYDNTSDQAFGPVFSGPSADTEVQEFMDWLKTDPRSMHEDDLVKLAWKWSHLPSVEYVGEDGLREPDGVRYLGGGRYGSTDA